MQYYEITQKHMAKKNVLVVATWVPAGADLAFSEGQGRVLKHPHGFRGHAPFPPLPREVHVQFLHL